MAEGATRTSRAAVCRSIRVRDILHNGDVMMAHDRLAPKYSAFAIRRLAVWTATACARIRRS
jgi:hypothetical protein